MITADTLFRPHGERDRLRWVLFLPRILDPRMVWGNTGGAYWRAGNGENPYRASLCLGT